jgi:5-methylcytosine-specific restriction endonuclease McrA
MFYPKHPIALGLVTAKAGVKAKSARRSKRRALREKNAPRVEGETVTLAFIFDRDQVRGCCICKAKVTRDQASIEHRVPLSKGGAHDEGNCQLAHKRCNSRKGSSVGPRKKGLRRKAFRPKPRALPPPEEGMF